MNRLTVVHMEWARLQRSPSRHGSKGRWTVWGWTTTPKRTARLKSCQAASVVPSPIQEECELRGLSISTLAQTNPECFLQKNFGQADLGRLDSIQKDHGPSCVPRLSSMALSSTGGMGLHDLRLIKRSATKTSVTAGTLSARQLHVVSGGHSGWCRDRTFPPSQIVLGDGAGQDRAASLGFPTCLSLSILLEV